jgi:structure-specific recognition protein 1
MVGEYETFENIYLDLSKESGKCRFAAGGVGWKPSGGETWTLPNAEIQAAHWSRAAKGHEVKIYTRTGQIIQLDGFSHEVCAVY